ncbi:PilW family protein [Extensimonas vulgaris]|nr:PilW family protein [Extensimonas vulgaris]TXD14592.1 prepilin-type N-terminal cleavage/methylation domain-containing protein [Extensimonas vulgaris]
MPALSRRRAASREYQKGFTLVELMVALVLSLLIVLAATAALLVARQGFTAVDAASQLRDNTRFAQDIIQRVGVQTGFKTLAYIANPAAVSNTQGIPTNIPPNVYGLNNASRTPSDAWTAGTSRSSGSVGYGSDILVLRFQPNASDTDATKSDGSMIDCSGNAPTAAPANIDDQSVSILHVGVDADGEPSLMCSRSDTGSAPYDTQPLVRGVENFQVLYGVDGIGPGNTTVPIPATASDTIPERYLRADQLTVAGNQAATYANWKKVRSIRIGMVVRAAPNTAVDNSTHTYYPLGETKDSSGGTIGSAFANATSDPGTIFTPAADGRMRQVVTFIVHLRNAQENN